MYRFLFVLILFFSIASCRDNTGQDNVPEVFVDITLQLSLPTFNNLTIPGSWTYVTGGSRGIIVYALASDDHVAFDRHCPYQVDGFHRVSVQDTLGTVAVDIDNCGSKFSIISGDVLQDPAILPLKQYQTEYFPASNTLRIYN